MDLDEYRSASLRQWERSAEGWARRREEMQRRASVVSRWMVDAVDPRPGETVLELAAGPGDTGFLAAGLVGPDGGLISSDFSEPMLDAARDRARELEVENVEFRVLNAESLDLPAASVDCVLCRWGYMLMADPAAALQETRRVLRPGGRLALAAWDAPDANPWVSLMAAAIREAVDAPAPDPDAPGMFAFARPGRLESLLDGAGFADVRVAPLDFSHVYDSFGHWWELQLDLARPMAELVEQCTARQREAIKQRLRERSRAFAGDEGLAFPARALMASATA